MQFTPLATDGAQEIRGRLQAWWEERPHPGQKLAELYQLAAFPPRLAQGDVLLIAWTDHAFGGMEIDPVASQQSRQTLVVAHLRYGPLPEPDRDRTAAAEPPAETEMQGDFAP